MYFFSLFYDLIFACKSVKIPHKTKSKQIPLYRYILQLKLIYGCITGQTDRINLQKLLRATFLSHIVQHKLLSIKRIFHFTHRTHRNSKHHALQSPEFSRQSSSWQKTKVCSAAVLFCNKA